MDMIWSVIRFVWDAILFLFLLAFVLAVILEFHAILTRDRRK